MPKPEPPTETNAARAVRLRGATRASLKACLCDLEALISLGNTDVTVQPILGDKASWQELVDTAMKISGFLYSNEPPTPSLDLDEDDYEDYEDYEAEDDEDGLG